MNVNFKLFCVHGFAEELDELIYEGLSNWVISFRSLFTVYAAHFSYLVVFISIIICGVLSYRHSVENGKKFTHFWFGAFVHGFLTEHGLSATKYWHAQAPIMFFGKQLPLHILLFYPSTIYLSTIAVHRLKLNPCTEPAAVGLIAMLMEIPFRMISVKFIHITYHDSDPMYQHKLCGVPWVEIFSSLIFAMSYVAVYHCIKYYQVRDSAKIWDNDSPHRREYLTTLLIGFLSPIVGFLQKILLFHFLNDFFNVNPISCLFFVISVYVSFVVCFEPKKLQRVIEESNSKGFLFYQIIIYLSCLLFLALFGKPQNEVSIGRHEPTGDCTTIICSRTPLGKEIQRRKFLCTSDLCKRSRFLYNFDCVPKGAPSFNANWYTICGTAFGNRVNFLLVISSCLLFVFAFYMRTLFPKYLKLPLRKFLIPKPLKRKKYLCADEVAARKSFVYNFDCLQEGPPCLQAIWYTICGSPIYNKPQFFLNVLSFIILLFTIFYKTLLTDAKHLDATKRLLVWLRDFLLRRSTRSATDHTSGPPAEEVVVGYVLISNLPQEPFKDLTQLGEKFN